MIMVNRISRYIIGILSIAGLTICSATAAAQSNIQTSDEYNSEEFAIILTNSDIEYERMGASEKLENYPTFTNEFRQQLGLSLSIRRPFVIDFTASWCMPCQQFAPTFQAYASKYRGKIDLVSCDVDRYRGISANYGVKAIPNILFFNADGRPVKRFLGGVTAEDFERELENLLILGIEGIEDGAYAEGDDEYYTLDGLRATHPQKGIYIKDGKKVWRRF